MASCCRRYRARRLKALSHDPQFLVNRPAPPATSLDHLKPFKLSTALMAVHKDCYAPIGLIQQGGPRRRETSLCHASTLRAEATKPVTLGHEKLYAMVGATPMKRAKTLGPSVESIL